MDIEAVAQKQPDAILKEYVDIAEGSRMSIKFLWASENDLAVIGDQNVPKNFWFSKILISILVHLLKIKYQ